MDPQHNAKLEQALKDIEQNEQVLKVQVLNNLDALVNPSPENKGPSEGVDLLMLDRLVKAPLMRAVTKIKNARTLILKLRSDEQRS